MVLENHLIWHETTSGRYERDVDEAELFYTTFARLFEGIGRTAFAITGFIELSLPIPEHESPSKVEHRLDIALLEAWRRLHYDHPTLRSVVKYDSERKTYSKLYETFANDTSGAKELVWLEQSFKRINNGKSGLEFCNDDPPVNKFPTLFVITPPTDPIAGSQNTLKRHIVFRSLHDIIDGIGTLILLNNLFTHASKIYAQHTEYSKLIYGDEYKNLSPSFRVAANVPSAPTQEQIDRFQAIAAKNQADMENTEVIGIPFELKTNLPGKSQRAAISLSEFETKEILEKCKILGTTVTHAFHAGVVMVVRDLQERKDQERMGRYVNYCLVNLRGKCSPPFDSHLHPAAVYHSASGKNLVIDVAIPGESSPPQSIESTRAEFASILHEIKEFYVSVQTDPQHIAMVPLYFGSKISNGISPDPEQEVCELPPANKSPSVSISSMGVIDKIIQPRHGDFCLNNPWVTGDELSTGVGVFLGTWNGRLSLSAAYNEAYHKEEVIVEFLRSVQEIVFQGLGVKVA